MTRDFTTSPRSGQDLYHARDAEITKADGHPRGSGRRIGYRLAVLEEPGTAALHIRHSTAARYFSWQVTSADGYFRYARILITTQSHSVAVERAAPPLLRPLIFGFVIEYDRLVFEAGDGLGLEYRHHIAR